jgi:hypothetical protein
VTEVFRACAFWLRCDFEAGSFTEALFLAGALALVAKAGQPMP